MTESERDMVVDALLVMKFKFLDAVQGGGDLASVELWLAKLKAVEAFIAKASAGGLKADE